MIRLIASALFVFLLSGCFLGEDGQNGKDGRDAKSYVYTGVLFAADTSMNGSAVYWDKPILTLTDSSVVNVWVRQGSGYLWQPPTWYVQTTGIGYVRIIDDEKTNAAYEYKIVVSN